ncbi:hypothetical protein [Ideonella sp.]|jgi:hypothetical protein|uniref:hypothetical protein n=1 Tax=Ideonella sp. TaxID=1929293 RepID=UPI0037C0CA7F
MDFDKFFTIALAVAAGTAFVAGGLRDANKDGTGVVDDFIRWLHDSPVWAHVITAVLAAGVAFWWDGRPKETYEECVIKNVKAGMSDDVAAVLVRACAMKDERWEPPQARTPATAPTPPAPKASAKLP